MGLTRAAYNGNTRLIGDPLRLPLLEGLLNSRRVLHVILLGLLFAFLFLALAWPYLLALVDIDDGWGVLLGRSHDHGDHLLAVTTILCKDTLDAQRAQIKHH